MINRDINSSFFAIAKVVAPKVIGGGVKGIFIVKETTCRWTKDVIVQYHRSKCPFRTVCRFSWLT